jgi:hypothetical protein
MDIISKRTGAIIVDQTSLRLTLSEELTDLGCAKENNISITLVQNGKDKQIIIEKIK